MLKVWDARCICVSPRSSSLLRACYLPDLSKGNKYAVIVESVFISVNSWVSPPSVHYLKVSHAAPVSASTVQLRTPHAPQQMALCEDSVEWERLAALFSEPAKGTMEISRKHVGRIRLVSRTLPYRDKKGTYPRPVRIGPKSRWLEVNGVHTWAGKKGTNNLFALHFAAVLYDVEVMYFNLGRYIWSRSTSACPDSWTTQISEVAQRGA